MDIKVLPKIITHIIVIIGLPPVISSFVPYDVPIIWYVIIALVLGLFDIAWHLHVFYKENKKLKQEFDKIKTNRDALSKLFEEKQAAIEGKEGLIQKYKEAVNAVKLLLLTNEINIKELKFKKLSEAIITHFNNVDRSG